MIDLNERMNRLPPEAKQIVRDWIDANKKEYVALKQYCRELETRLDQHELNRIKLQKRCGVYKGD